jgi:hypothetical protein
VLEKRHTFALDGLHEPGLRDALADQRDDVSVQVGQGTREAQQGLSGKKKKMEKTIEEGGGE